IRSAREKWSRGYIATSKQSRLALAPSQAAGKTLQDTPAPNDPPQGPVSVLENASRHFTILGYGPNPTRDALSISYVVDQPTEVRIILVDSRGVEAFSTSAAMEHGLHSVVLDLHALGSGRYTLMIHAGADVVKTGIVVVR
ncbi:MAG: hypothetical protein NTX15_03675, partial [Candidatus Kapabacteria bacterium]|nr:hypothetical protein [Candidatus Kapabacteria bacterium]